MCNVYVIILDNVDIYIAAAISYGSNIKYKFYYPICLLCSSKVFIALHIKLN